ncbi:MAG: metallophosphoesterase family protein [Candidatus Limnocylindrales bacterium]
MRIAVLSDIHGNLPALEAVLAALEPYDAIWQLGDVVGYGPEPDAVVARLRELGATGVRGNHDAAAIGDLPTTAFNSEARAAVLWTASVIAAATRAWLTALPEIAIDGDYTLAHGSPREPLWEYVLTTPTARANFAALTTRHALIGHTHLPLVFREDDGLVETIAPSDASSLALDARRTLLNPGSVGQPRDGDPRACGAVLDTEVGTMAWRRVAYDIAAVQERMRRVGLPKRLIDRLDHGQ